jgi:hypothetical protein
MCKLIYPVYISICEVRIPINSRILDDDNDDDSNDDDDNDDNNNNNNAKEF